MCVITNETYRLNVDEGATPTTLDVLYGRGRSLQKHQGNQRFLAIVDSYGETYDISTKAEKTKIAEYIVQQIRQQGGRFLRKDENTCQYHEVGNACARDKASHALRTRRTKHHEPKKKPKKKMKIKKLPDVDQVVISKLLQIQQETFKSLVDLDQDGDGDNESHMDDTDHGDLDDLFIYSEQFNYAEIMFE